MKFLNSSKTREKITGVLIGLVLSALCVTPALAVGMDSTSIVYEVVNLIRILYTILGILLAALAVWQWVMSMVKPDPATKFEFVYTAVLTGGLIILDKMLENL